MSSEVAALPFQAHANYGTWSIDFDYFYKNFAIISTNNFSSVKYCPFV